MSTDKEIRLYYVPSSYCCQKVRLALEEKEIVYNETIVWVLDNEQEQPWYLSINPTGEVPTLKVGSRHYYGPEKLINLVDKLPSVVHRKLVPEKSDCVSYWRKWLDEIQIPLLTFGVMVFPKLLRSGAARHHSHSQAPGGHEVKERFTETLVCLQEMMKHNPHLQSYYTNKILLTKQKLRDFFDKEKVETLLEGIDTRIPHLERQLLTASRRSTVSGEDYFLCGPAFTAADINLCVLLGRFQMLGLLPRYANPRKYPFLFLYWLRVQQRPSVQKVIFNTAHEMKRLGFRRRLRRYSARFPVVLLVVGATGLLAYTLVKMKKGEFNPYTIHTQINK